MQSLLILSLLLTVWLSRDARTQREPSESKQIAISTSLTRSSCAEAHHFRWWVMGTYKSDLSPVAHADSWAVIPQSLHRGGLVMTTGGHPPPEIKRRSLSCSAGRR